jgi:hypothetical protein
MPTGTTIQDGAGNNIDLSGFATIDTGVQVDTTAPTLGTETSSSLGGTDIAATATVTFSIDTSEAVIVTNGGNGLPTLTLNDGEVATYTGGVGSSVSSLTFSYTVQAGDNVADLQATAFNMPTGTTIQDGAGNNIDLSGFATIDTGVQVDTTAPTLGTETSSSPGGTDIAATATVTFSIDTSEAVIVTNGGNGLPALTLNDGEVASYTGIVGSSVNTLTFSYTVQAGDNTADLQATAFNMPTGTTIQDGAGNNIDLSGFTTIDTGVQVDTLPKLSGVATSVDYGSAPILLSPNLTAADPDGDNLTGATVVVTGGFANDGDVLTATETNTNITALYNSANETLTLSGSDTAANYTAVLESVTFQSSDFNANNAGANDTRTVTWTINEGDLSNITSPTTTIQIGSPAVDDYTGSGTSDILFRDDPSGDTGFYQISNGANVGWVHFGSATAYSAVGAGDFMGNGTDDILFRDNATGDTGFYTISNGVNTGWVDVGGSSTAYSVVGVGDFMGNGTDDILFRDNATGDTGFYAISNGVNTGWVDLGGSSTAYSVVGVGEFTGIGTDDILFRNNSTGDTGFYEMVNGNNTGWHDIGGSSTAYHTVS